MEILSLDTILHVQLLNFWFKVVCKSSYASLSVFIPVWSFTCYFLLLPDLHLENYLQLMCLEFCFLKFPNRSVGFVDFPKVNFCGTAFYKVLSLKILYYISVDTWVDFIAFLVGGAVIGFEIMWLVDPKFCLETLFLPFCFFSSSFNCQKVFIVSLSALFILQKLCLSKWPLNHAYLEVFSCSPCSDLPRNIFRIFIPLMVTLQ